MVLLPALFMSVRIGGAETHRFGEFVVRPRGSWLPFVLQTVCERQFPITVAFNMPGVLIGSPVSVPVVLWFRSHPTALVTLKTWHTLSIPFFCLPAWWFVGNSLDRLREAKRLHPSAVLLSSLLFIGCIALAIGISTSPPLDKQDLLPFFWGASIWAVIFGMLPLAWAYQKRRDRDGH